MSETEPLHSSQSPDKRSRSAAWARVLACLLVCELYSLFSVWSEGPHQSDGYYPLLADAFLRGEVNVEKEGAADLAKLPDPYDPAQNSVIRDKYQLGDLSFRNGKFYLYFGPAPAILVFAPYKALTGKPLSQACAGFLFCVVGFLALVDFHRNWGARRVGTPPAARVFLETVALGVATFAPVLMTRMYVYEVAIAGGFCLLAVGLALLFRAVNGTGRARPLLFALSGLALGLSIASRPNLLPGCAVISAGLIYWARGVAKRETGHRSLGFTALFLGPLALCVLGELIYNGERFGNPLEFGQLYQLAGLKIVGRGFFALRNVATNLEIYLFRMPRITAYFPFLLTPESPMRPFSTTSTDEGGVGIFFMVPLVWFCVPEMVRSFRRRRAPGGDAAWPLLLAAVSAVNLAILVFAAGSSARYILDFLPYLVLCAILSRGLSTDAMALRTGAVAARRLGRSLYGAACLISVLAVACYAVQFRSRFRNVHPDAYRQLFRTFSLPTIVWERVERREFGALEMAVRPLPAGPLGETLGLVHFHGPLEWDRGTGGNTLECGFVIRRVGDRQFQIGYARSQKPVVWSTFFLAGASGAFQARLRIGSLYPPVQHPYWDFDPSAERRWRPRVRVDVDGTRILDFLVEPLEAPYPSPVWGFPVPNMEYPPIDGQVVSWRFAAARD